MAKHFTIKKQEEEYLEFELMDVNISLANAIRRVVLSEIETLAIDDKNVKIIENTCPLHNEYISHRVSLIPVKQFRDISGLEFYISKKNTKDIPIENEQLGILEVTTNNIQIYDTNTDSWINPEDIFDGVYLITKLNIKQKFLATFTITKGTAMEHSRWQCVNSIAYRYKTKADLQPNQEYDKISLEEEHSNWIKKGSTDEPAGFLFYLESNGKMNCDTIIYNALEIINNKCFKFIDYIQKNKNDIVWHKSGMIEVEYEGEMHTLGNLISTMGLELLGEQDFIGYRIVHPMLNKFILRMKIYDNDSREEHIRILLDLVSKITTFINKLKVEWESI